MSIHVAVGLVPVKHFDHEGLHHLQNVLYLMKGIGGKNEDSLVCLSVRSWPHFKMHMYKGPMLYMEAWNLQPSLYTFLSFLNVQYVYLYIAHIRISTVTAHVHIQLRCLLL